MDEAMQVRIIDTFLETFFERLDKAFIHQFFGTMNEAASFIKNLTWNVPDKAGQIHQKTIDLMKELAPEVDWSLEKAGRLYQIGQDVLQFVKRELKMTKMMQKKLGPDQVLNELSSSERCMISKGFTPESFTIEKVMQQSTQPGAMAGAVVRVMRRGVGIPGIPDIPLISKVTKWVAFLLPIISLVVEIIWFLFCAIGIDKDIKDIAAIIYGAGELIQNVPAVIRAATRLAENWSNASDLEKAIMIFTIIQEIYAAKILWNLVKLMLMDMSDWDKLRTVAVVAAQVLAAIDTGGVVLFAKIVLALNRAYNMANDACRIKQKVKNILAFKQEEAQKPQGFDFTRAIKG